ncbi:MAG TPA: hypothetical protein VHS78_00320 [Candidatus Elarobacter sp.]|jgi:hypothetical protein|nr:hypothetical protein [Candidatus Elarobacter sp.]
MLKLRSLALAAFAAVLVPMTVSPASAIPMGATLTNVKPPSLHIANGMLTGQLQQTNSCNKVQFILSPATIVPPIYGAYQVPIRKMGCVMLTNHWVTASVKAIGKAANVHAKNGNFNVK